MISFKNDLRASVKPAASQEHTGKALGTGWEPSGMQNEVTSASITCHASFSLFFWPAESWVSAEVDRDRNDFFLAMTERCL